MGYISLFGHSTASGLTPGVSPIDPELVAPSGFSAVAVDHQSIYLSWGAVPNTITATPVVYHIYRDLTPNPTTPLDTTTDLEYTDAGLDPETTYYYAIEAHYHGPQSSDSVATDAQPLDYGYPFGGAVESDVAAQWAFQEASGDIVDEVSAVTLADTGTMDYQQAGAGDWSAFTGIRFNSNGEYFDKNSASAELHLGTADFTIEWVAKYGVTAQDTTVCYCSVTAGYILAIQGVGPGKSYFYFKATDATTTVIQITPSVSPFDNTEHHHRVAVTGRGTGAAKLEWFIDNVSMGTAAFTAMNGKTIENQRMFIGWSQAIAYKLDGTVYEFRLSNNGTNNSYLG